MNPLSQLFITISINLSALAASSGWLSSQNRVTDVWGSFGLGQTSVRVDRHVWQIENGVFPSR